MFKRVKFLIASIFAILLWATPASALSSNELEQISTPSESIEINTPTEGYDFDATFLSKDQELQFETTITNDAEKDITINDVTLNESSYDFFDYSFSGLQNDDTIRAGESRKVILTIRTNNNDTQTVSEDYHLSIAYTENEEEFDNPETSALKIVPIVAAVSFATLSIFVVLTKSAKRRFFILAIAVPALGVFLLTQNTIAKETENLDILGNIHFINSYTVTVDPDGGVYANTEQPTVTTLREGEIFHVGEAARDTYTFERWEINPGELDENNNVEIHSDTLIRAIWNENHHTLTINPNGGSYKGVAEISTFTYREGKTVDIETPIRNTYNFTGWTVEPNTTFDGSITMDKDYTLTANWEEIYYTLTIDPRGGNHEGHTEAYDQSIRAGNKVCLSSPARDTYNFTGWLSDEAELDSSSCFRMEQNTTFTATWDEVFYTLTINPNGGKYGNHNEEFTQNRRADTQVCLDTPVRSTYSFAGWTSNDIELDSQSCFIIKKDSNFTANWEEIYYTLSIDLNGGNYNGETEVPSAAYRAGTTVPIATPEYTGHDFTGWTRNETESFNSESVTMNENISLVANWDDIYFNVTINPNGGKYNNLETTWEGRVKYGDSINLSGTTWEDHEITHWTQNNDEIAADSSTIEIYEDTDFVAYWQSTIFHTVTIIPNGGIYDESTEPKEYSVRKGTNFPLVKATREDDGFAFESWYLGDTVDPDKKFPTGDFVVEEDTTLIANWFKIVARIERTGEVYPSIMAAHEEANPGNITKDIITLLVDTEEIVTNTKEVTLDLNTHVVSGYINNTVNGNLTLINGEINNYDDPIVDTVNPNGAAVVNNGSLTMGKDNYLEDDDNHKEPIIEGENIRLIGTEVGLQQNNIFYFYDGFIEGVLGLVGGYDGSPWYRDTFDGVVIHYFPFVTHNNTKDCQHVELSNADKAVSKTTIHGDIYYYNLQDNINTSTMTGYQIYAVRDFDASYTLTIPTEGEDIVFDIIGYEVNLGDDVTINNKLTVKDSKTGDEAGLLTSSKTIVNNGTLDLQNVKVSALTANTLLRNRGTLNATNATLYSNKGVVLNVTGDNAIINMDNDSHIKSESNSAAISNDSTNLRLISGNVTGQQCTIRNNNSASVLTISGGNVFAPYRAICNEYGTVNINGGNISSERTGNEAVTIYTYSGNLNIGGGTISSHGDVYALTIDSYSAIINVTNGNLAATSDGYGYARIFANSYGEVTIDGKDAKLTSTNTANGNAYVFDKYASTLNVKQGSLTAEANTGEAIIATSTNSTYNISGGTLTAHSKDNNAYGTSALYWSGSTTNISGGNISATTDNSDKVGIGIMTSSVNATDGYIYGSTYGIEGYNSNTTATINIGENKAPLYNGQDGTEAKPIIQGGVYALNRGYVNFYDGILKGGSKYINDPAYIRAVPDGTNFNVVDLEDPVEQDCWLVTDNNYLHLESDGKDYNSLSEALRNAADTDLITVIEDKTTPATIIANEKDITIDLDGHTVVYSQQINNSGTLTIKDKKNSGILKNTNGSAKVINNNGTFNLQSGSILGNECTIQNNSDKIVNITGGNVASANRAICNSQGTVNISGGNIRTARADSNETIFASYGTLNISGGTISASADTTNWSSASTITQYSGEINVTGGTLSATAHTGYAYVFTDSYSTVTIDGEDVNITATITGNGYPRAINKYAATVNIKKGTITAETKEGNSAISDASACLFNIDGGTMTAYGESGDAYGISGLWSNGSSVNMKGGSITATTDGTNKVGIGLITSVVNITGGYVYGNTYGIAGENNGYISNVTIGENKAPLYNGQDGIEAKPIIKGGTYAINNGYVLFYDGILKGGEAYIDNETVIKAIPDGTSRVITNYENPKEQDCWLENDEDYLLLDSNNQTYNSLTEALSYAQETDKLTVTRDASTQAVLPAIEKNITLDLDGNTLYYSQPIINNSSLTIVDSKSNNKDGAIINNNGSVRVIENNGTLKIEAGVISGKTCAIQNKASKTLTISGGAINAVNQTVCNDNGTVNISDGVLTATSTGSTEAIHTYGGEVNISGGTISASTTSGNWSSTSLIYQYSGTVNITGGTLSATNSYGQVYGFTDSYGTTTIDGEDVRITVANTGSGDATVFAKYASTLNLKKGTLIAETNDSTAYIGSSSACQYNITGGSASAHSKQGNAYGINSLWSNGSTVNISGGNISAITDNPNKVGIGIMCNTINATDGTIYGSSYGIYGYNDGYASTVNLGKNDGTIYNGQAGVAAKPTIRGGTYGIAQGNVNFYDGLLEGGVDGYYDRNIKAIADQSYMHQTTETIDEKEYVVKYLAAEENLAKIGDGDCDTDENTTCYPSIQTAINAANENDKIQLLKDNYVFNSIKIPADKTVTIDTKGYNIITGAFIENYGNLTFVNSNKAESNPVIDYREGNRFILNKTGATLRIDDLKLKSSSDTIISEGGSTVTLNRVNINSANNAVTSYGTLTITDSTIYGNAIAILQYASEITVSGSTLSSYNNAISLGNGNNSITGTFTNTTITDLNNAENPGHYGIYTYSWSSNKVTVTFSGCTITGWLNNYYSDITIKDSTITRVVSYNYPAISNNNGTLVLDNTKVSLTNISQNHGINESMVLDNSGTATLKNKTQLELLFDMKEWYGISDNARIISNSGTVNLDDAKLINTSFKFHEIHSGPDSARTYGIYNTGTVNYTNSTIELTRYDSLGIYNESGTTQINSGSIKAGGHTAHGVWVKNGSLTMGEAEPTDSEDYGKATAHVSTTEPYIEALGSNSGIGVTLETGSFNFYDGKILHRSEVGPAVQSNGTDKATVTEVEYLYQPEKHQDENGNYYFVLEFMR